METSWYLQTPDTRGAHTRWGSTLAWPPTGTWFTMFAQEFVELWWAGPVLVWRTASTRCLSYRTAQHRLMVRLIPMVSLPNAPGRLSVEDPGRLSTDAPSRLSTASLRSPAGPVPPTGVVMPARLPDQPLGTRRRIPGRP